MIDVRHDFPFLHRCVNGQRLVYLDSAATTQKPASVIDRVQALYASGISNVHRATNFLSDEVTEAFETARETVARFINADPDEIVFTANATHAIHLVSQNLPSSGARVITTQFEHHSNLLPWRTGRDARILRVDRDGHIDLDDLKAAAADGAHLAAVARASNFLGTLQPVCHIVRICHAAGVPVLVDASQSIAHERHDVRAIGCDYLVFSGHKLYGPSGVGVLFARRDLAKRLQPVVRGGHTVKEVSAASYVLNDVPHRFEAGTPNIEGVIGLGAAIEYVEQLGFERIGALESQLTSTARRLLDGITGVRRLGPSDEMSAPLVPFVMPGLESSAAARLLANRWNIILRSGFHCAQPAHDVLGVGPTLRASFAVYNTEQDVECLARALTTLTQVTTV